MGLIKRNIHMDGCRHENKTISLDQDYNIPDMKPDAKMIIREQGDIVNLECRSMGEKFGIKGGDVVPDSVYSGRKRTACMPEGQYSL